MVGLSPSRKSCHGCRFEETAVGSPATAEPVVDPSWKIFVRALIHSLSCPPPQSYTGPQECPTSELAHLAIKWDPEGRLLGQPERKAGYSPREEDNSCT